MFVSILSIIANGFQIKLENLENEVK